MSSDIFDDAPVAIGAPRPHMKQLTTGAKEVERTYGKGTPQEYTAKSKGRVLIVVPKSIKYKVPSTIKNDDGSAHRLQDQIMATVHVLDGEPIKEQLDGEGDVKAEFKEPLVPPFTFDALISQTMLVEQLADVVGTGFRFGALSFLPGRNGRKKPYVLFSTTPKEKADAAKYYAAWKAAQPDPFDEI